MLLPPVALLGSSAVGAVVSGGLPGTRIMSISSPSSSNVSMWYSFDNLIPSSACTVLPITPAASDRLNERHINRRSIRLVQLLFCW